MISLYKPNSKNNGCAFNFQIGTDNKSKEPTLYVSAIQQYSWDADKRIGSFSKNRDNPEKNINVKLDEFECGEIISAFRNRNEYSTFHAFGDNKTSIKFVPWDKKYKPYGSDKEQLVRAFGINISRSGNTFKIPLEPGDIEVLSRFLKHYLDELIKGRVSRQQKQYRDKGKSSSTNGHCEEAPF
tara:strand:- start:13830 stop:14381 length:552 start_codon:yes stop_codon:yes gene_type:complete